MKPSVTPSAPAATKSPDAAKAGVAGVQTVRTGLVSPATGSNAARILLLAGFVLGALLVAIATVLPAIAARFTLPGRVVIEHQMDLKILGVALSIVTVLVYVLGTTGH